MKAHEFITAYSRSRPRLTVRDARLDGFLEESREHAFRHGELLHDYLSGRLHTSRQALHAYQRSYLSWTATEPLFPQFVGYAEDKTTLEEPVIRTLMEFNFHRLNRHMFLPWDVALYHPGGMSRWGVQEVRTLIAIAALELVHDRAFALKEELWFTDNDEARLLRAGLTGALAECDALIALLEVTRRDELVLVLPAPPQFEHAHRSTNVDFIVIDKRTGNVQGIQVKASGSASRADYDPDRVMVLDTSQDLEDRLAMRTRPLSSDKRVVPWPGLIAAHYLRDVPIPRRSGIFADSRDLVKWKGMGRHFTGDTKSCNEAVFGDVADRVFARLRGT